MKKLLSNQKFRYGLFVMVGIILGWLIFHTPRTISDDHDHLSRSEQATIWTCAMHPQIQMPEPGKCPICAMDLIPLKQSNVVTDPGAVHLTKEAIQLANVMTSVVSRQKAVHEVRLYGKVQADERLLQTQVAHIPGRIENLLVSFTGETVQQGQSLAILYSPELITAEQELLEAANSKQSQPEIYEAAREKLRQWKIPESQISAVEQSGKIREQVEVVSNTTGIVTARRVNKGDYVNQGAVLFEVADLSKVWVLFDAYESDLMFLRVGDELEFTVQALPGTRFSGKISFIDPVIDPVTRVARVRTEAVNQNGRLKPEMFVTGIVRSGMDEFGNAVVIPRSAVLWTGKRSVVYVKNEATGEPVFNLREIDLGPMMGNGYVVTDGLSEGEEIVTQGAFSVDAAAQLEGKPSMMNKEDDKVTTAYHPEDEHIPVNEQFNSLFDQYIVLKNAFVQSDAKKVQQAARHVQQFLAQTEMKSLKGDALTQWLDISRKLNNQIRQIASSSVLEEQRILFSDFNLLYYKAVRNFGLMAKTVYYQFCPMANNGAGAYWLSETLDIRNPYYGEEMLTCGETKETLTKKAE